MSIDFEALRREGPEPAIYPNAGHRRKIVWTSTDVRRFVASLRAEFPNAFLYNYFDRHTYRQEKPEVKIIERVDDIEGCSELEILLPYPGWEPELIQLTGPESNDRPRWTWANYLSPIFWFGLPGSISDSQGYRADWQNEGRPRVRPTASWASPDLMTSYRRQLPEEQRILEKMLRLVRKLCVLAVPVMWRSEADFLKGNGRVLGRPRMPLRSCWVTPVTLEWCRAAPDRVLGLTTWASGGAHGYLPADAVPDSWWGDISRPKWAQRP